MLGGYRMGAIPWGINPRHPSNDGLLYWLTTMIPNLDGGATWIDLAGRYHSSLVSMGAGSGWQSSGATTWPMSMKFDGSASYVVPPPSAGVAATKNYTVAMWIKTTSTAANTIFYGEGNSGSNTPFLQFGLNQTDATTLFAYQRDDAGIATAGGAGLLGSVVVNNGKWHHVIILSTNFNMALYVDGIQDGSLGSQASLGASTLNLVTIGALRYTPTSGFWAGQIADVRAYPFAFDAQDVQRLYQESRDGYPEALLWWRPSLRIFDVAPDPIFPYPISMAVP